MAGLTRAQSQNLIVIWNEADAQNLHTSGIALIKWCAVRSEPGCVKPRLQLAVVLHRIWIDGTEFEWSKEAANQPA